MIELRLLGRLNLTSADGRDVRSLLGQPRRLALLAYLAAATPQGFHRRDSLLALFWPELDQEHARAALRQALHVVRHALGADAVASRGDEEIGLDFAQVSCDVGGFEHALRRGQLEQALDLYRGALLEGFFISDAPEFERWLETARARLQQAAAGAARALAERYENRNDLAAAVRWTRRAMELALSDEGLVRRLMALLDRQGDRAGALEVYEALARRVAAEYDAEPAAETRALLAAVRARVQVAPPAALLEADSPPPLGAVPPRRRWGRLAMSVGISAAGALVLLVGLSVGGQRGRSHPATPPSRNAEAYDLYLRANMLVNQRQNRENDSVAITLFERIVALDPSFAAAQAGLARAYALRVSEFAPGDTAALQRAQVAAEKALRLDPNLAEAHQAQARLLWGPSNNFFHERAIQEDLRALSLDPNMDRAHQHLGNIYLHIGLLDEAIVELQKALAISPREDNALRRIAEARAYQGHYDDALRILSQVDPEANPPYWYYEMAIVLLHLGRSDSAFALIRNYLQAHPEDRGGVVTSARAVWFASAGDAHHAEQDIQTAIQKGKGYIHFHHAGYHIALAYALLHRPDSAVQWLHREAEGGMPCYPLFVSDPFLNNIRSDPGFVAFLREQKAQWEQWQATLVPKG
jgi:DNA-binding SARP family transcriptional activator/Flp pilus assembly protein TadD